MHWDKHKTATPRLRCMLNGHCYGCLFSWFIPNPKNVVVADKQIGGGQLRDSLPALQVVNFSLNARVGDTRAGEAIKIAHGFFSLLLFIYSKIFRWNFNSRIHWQSEVLGGMSVSSSCSCSSWIILNKSPIVGILHVRPILNLSLYLAE
jgi:hypothetical protein